MIRAAALLFLVLLVAKTTAATKLDLFGDEAFYWMCSQRLDVAFADHPFMTAALVRGGTELAGASSLGVRALFLALGALLPVLVYLLARPLVGRRDALLAGAASLVVPATAHLGVLALPDVPLLVFAAAALLGFERATRTGAWPAWILAGASTALALATHYRGVLIPFAFGLYSALTPGGRRTLRTLRPWVAGAIGATGFLPVLIYNVRLDFAPLRFQGVERHAGFDVDGLLEHLPLQAAAVTPAMYVALIASMIVLLRRGWSGDDRAALLGTFAVAHLGLFFVTSPIADSSHATIHWPAPGYLPLLVYLPPFLREFVRRKPTRTRRVLAALVPGIGLAGVLVVLVELATGVFSFGPLHRPFAGWADAAAACRRHLDAASPQQDGRRMLVAGDYLLAGNLDLKLHGLVDVYVLDHPKNHEHGRAAQFPLWDRDEEALAARKGVTALVVLDKDQSRVRDWPGWLAHVTALFDELDPLEEVRAEGRREERPRFYLFRGAR